MINPASASRDTIGPYRIVARVGAGGMGQVFKAWDPRLERDVAIKLLHPEMAGDAERQKRLLAEGRAASALNHPNILRVYDADVDGSSYYLVSEWLEGKSLRDELSRGPLPLKRLLDLAVQVADGLSAAHAMGIVHRDIKPENIMLARDGTARIVDFGLARSDPHAPAMAAAIGGASTMTASLEGGLSGTPAYMSPEQARGTAGDFRTDQFSFGALLYEMATGRHAFRRDTLADTLAAVLHDEPKPIVELNPRIPITFVWIVEQCLAKDAAERYAATEDLARELRRVREHLRHTLAVLPEPLSRANSRPWKALAGVTSAALAAAIAVLYLVVTTSEPRLTFTPIASAATYEGTPVWSPDGQSLAWVADIDGVLQAFVRRVGDAVSTQVTHGRFDAEEPFWAPDGRTIYFISRAGERKGLWSIATAGGRADLVLEDVNHAAIDQTGGRFALWRGDDSRSTQQLWWAGPNGREPVREARAPFGDNGFGTGGQLRFRPDGQAVLVWAFGDARNFESGAPSKYLLVPTAADGAVTEVLSGIARQANLQPVSWLPDNRHVVVGVADALGGNHHLWIADTQSPASRQLTATHTNETWPTASPDGRRIAYASEEVDFDLVTIAEDGRSRGAVLATARNEMDPAWAPNGEQFAFVTDRRGAVEIWTRSRDGQWERPIVTAADFSDARTDTLGALAFSPDGRTLAYQHRGSSQAQIWLSPTTGGAPVRLATRQEWSYQDAPAWSPDGEWISFVSSGGFDAMALVKIRLGSEEAVTLIDQVIPFTRPTWSPDGRWIACESNEGLVKVPADGGAKIVMLAEPPLAYAWSPDGRRLLALVDAEEALGHMALVEIDAVTHHVKTLNADLGTIPIARTPIRGFSVVKGQGILTSLARARSDIWILEGFQPPASWIGRILARFR